MTGVVLEEDSSRPRGKRKLENGLLHYRKLTLAGLVISQQLRLIVNILVSFLKVYLFI